MIFSNAVTRYPLIWEHYYGKIKLAQIPKVHFTHSKLAAQYIYTNAASITSSLHVKGQIQKIVNEGMRPYFDTFFI